MELPTMIIDLAVMLTTAGVVTIVFKKLKMPLILGYIVAGFLIGPHFPMFFDVSDQTAINTWSDIGIVIILFHIGLEFDFQRIANIGTTAIITAVVKVSGVMTIGYLFGKWLGLSSVSSIFLGAMLAISSTVVIKKCFEEQNLHKERYTSLVMGTLVMEDVISIVIIVVMSTVSVSNSINGGELVGKLLLMGCYLIIWLLLGIFLLPTVLNKVMDLMTDEMLTVLSLGFCFCMSLIAEKLGFSMELGAFVAGSLIAGTVHAENVERVTTGTKDLFGAVFFLSVGMLVDPSAIVKHWNVIVPAAIIAVVAKLIFGTIGMVFSGEDLRTAVKGGISLAPIGEFSFIIASLGISTGIMKSYLYPVIVAASILTIIITPVLIRRSDSAISFVKRILPQWLLSLIDSLTADESEEEENDPAWGNVVKSFFRKLLIYGVIMFVAAMLCVRFLEPALVKMMPDQYAKLLACAASWFIIILFLRPMMDFHSVSFTHLWMESRANHPPLAMIIIMKFAVVTAIAYIPIYALFGVGQIVPFIVVMALIVYLSKSDFITTSYLQLETRFLRNLNEKTIGQEEQERGHRNWLNEDYSIISFYVPKDADYSGSTLDNLAWGRNLDVYIVKIRRGTKYIMTPPGKTVIRAGDKLYAVGEKKALEAFYGVVRVEAPDTEMRTLRQFMEQDYPNTQDAMACVAIRVRGREPYCGKAIRNTGIQGKARCMILGIEKDGYTIKMPDAGILVQKGDIIWVLGANNRVGRLAALSAGRKSEKNE